MILDDNDPFSWIDENERLTQVDENYSKEPMKSILMHFIYVNVDSYISSVVSDTFYFKKHNDVSDISLNMSLSTSSCISNGEILKIIESKKRTTSTSKYKISDIILYNIDIEPQHIQSYLNADNVDELSVPFMKYIPSVMNEIIVPDSIFIFHTINCLYFIFNEVVAQKPQIVPIITVNGSTKVRKTKRVNFSLTKTRNTRK
jgi:hypothetical protein